MSHVRTIVDTISCVWFYIGHVFLQKSNDSLSGRPMILFIYLFIYAPVGGVTDRPD